MEVMRAAKPPSSSSVTTRPRRHSSRRSSRRSSPPAETGPVGKLTGYYVQEIHASRTKHGTFTIPILSRPPDLVMIDLQQFVKDGHGRRVWGRLDKSGDLVPFYTRARRSARARSRRRSSSSCTSMIRSICCSPRSRARRRPSSTTAPRSGSELLRQERPRVSRRRRRCSSKRASSRSRAAARCRASASGSRITRVARRDRRSRRLVRVLHGIEVTGRRRLAEGRTDDPPLDGRRPGLHRDVDPDLGRCEGARRRSRRHDRAVAAPADARRTPAPASWARYAATFTGATIVTPRNLYGGRMGGAGRYWVLLPKGVTK